MWGNDAVRIRSGLLVGLEGLASAGLSPVDIDLRRPCTLPGTDQALKVVHSTAILDVLGGGVLCNSLHRFARLKTIGAPPQVVPETLSSGKLAKLKRYGSLLALGFIEAVVAGLVGCTETGGNPSRG